MKNLYKNKKNKIIVRIVLFNLLSDITKLSNSDKTLRKTNPIKKTSKLFWCLSSLIISFEKIKPEKKI